MAILVCGGAGYVGSHMVAAALEQGIETVVVDTLEKGHRKAVKDGAVFYRGNLRDDVLMNNIFTGHRITTVINFAAYTSVPESVAQPQKYYENNVVGAVSLLKAMLKHDVHNIVFSSTASTYGAPATIPVTEDMPAKPVSPYGETKLAVEKMFKWYEGAYGLKYVALRYFNVAGAHPDGTIGEDHEPETHLIPIVLQTALGRRAALPLCGDDYETPDGTCVRDYVHVSDLADAHLLAMAKLEKDNTSALYNLGSGNGFSNLEIIEAARRVTRREIPVEIKERRPGDPPVLVASSEKIKRELNWNPTRTDLNTIIETAWAWHLSHPNGYED